jgi:hypothetical protein
MAACTNGTGSCDTTCGQTHATGAPVQAALQTCMSSHCAAECYPGAPNPCAATSGFYNVCGTNSTTGDPGRLYRCNGGSVSSSVICQNGCHAAPLGQTDYCIGSDPCVSSTIASNVVCGSSLSPAANAAILYTCHNQATTATTLCANGCLAAAPGQSDACE